jgi:hypothetical protein
VAVVKLPCHLEMTEVAEELLAQYEEMTVAEWQVLVDQRSGKCMVRR